MASVQRTYNEKPPAEEISDAAGPTTGLSVVIPTYNERPNIEPIIRRCLTALEDYQVEVLVVDDDSPDGTADLARKEFGSDERVRIVRRTRDPGLAQSVTHGFHSAKHEYCAVIDADLQHPPERLPELLSALEDGADLAIGSRHIEGGGIDNWSRFRRMVSDGATTLTRTVLPEARECSDPLSGFFAVRREIVESITLNPKGYKILLEVLAKGEYETVTEVPYVFRERQRGDSKLTAAEYKNFVEHLGALAVTSYGFDRFVEPYRAVRAAEFVTVGAIGTGVNMLAFAALHLWGGYHYLMAGVIAFVLALNFNFAGNWALTFDQPTEDIGAKYLRFHAVSVTGFVLYIGLLTTFIGFVGTNPLIANVVAILGASVFNFLGSEKFAFKFTPTNQS